MAKAAPAPEPESVEPAPAPAAPTAPEPASAPEQAVATVTRLPNGWHLVEHGTWQVSVGVDGLLMLPRHLSPGEAHDFAGAILAAGEVGAKVQADNEERAKGDGHAKLSSRVMTTAGGVPPGAVRLPVKPGGEPAKPRGSIGRRQRRGVPPATPSRRSRG